MAVQILRICFDCGTRGRFSCPTLQAAAATGLGHGDGSLVPLCGLPSRQDYRCPTSHTCAGNKWDRRTVPLSHSIREIRKDFLIHSSFLIPHSSFLIVVWICRAATNPNLHRKLMIPDHRLDRPRPDPLVVGGLGVVGHGDGSLVPLFRLPPRQDWDTGTVLLSHSVDCRHDRTTDVQRPTHAQAISGTEEPSPCPIQSEKSARISSSIPHSSFLIPHSSLLFGFVALRQIQTYTAN